MSEIKRVYINPGHSDKDPGAVGYEVERELAVKVAQYEKEHLLANYHCEVRMNPGTMGNLNDICEDANKWGAHLFDAKHFNASKNHNGDGYEAWVFSEERKDLGRIYEKHTVAIGQNSRGVKIQPGFVVLRNTKMPAILNECAFVDNKKDIEDWNDDAELKKMGIAHAEAAAEFLKLDKKEETITVKFSTLSYGLKNEEAVKVAQALLKGFGYKVNPTGNFGKGTKAAVEAMQKDYGLLVTGVVDAATWKALLCIK